MKMRRFCSGVNSTTGIRRLEPGMQAHGISAFFHTRYSRHRLYGVFVWSRVRKMTLLSGPGPIVEKEFTQMVAFVRE